MPSFFDKLNTLVQSQINSIIDPVDEKTSRSRRKALARHDIRNGLENNVAELRKRINEALAYQDQMQAKIDKLYRESAEWDRKADEAVRAGREHEARIAIGRVQQAQREIEMMEADLREHQYVTQELISQVNTLDGVISESRSIPDDERAPADDREASDMDRIGQQIVQTLDDTRQRLSDLVSSYTTQMTGQQPASRPYPKPQETDEPYRPERKRQVPIVEADDDIDNPATPTRPQPRNHPVDSQKVDDDLSARLARLSKPEKDDEN